MCSEVYKWLKSISSGLNLERLAREFEVRGFSTHQSLKYLQKEDLDAFFPSPQKLLLAEKHILQEEINKLKEPNLLSHELFPPPQVSRRISCSSNTVVQRYIYKFNLLLSEREGRTGEYWPEVMTIRTKRSEVRTKTTEGQYSPVRLKQARLVSSLLHGIVFL